MNTPNSICTCWPVETSNGAKRPLRWVDLHEHVVLVTTDNRVIHGHSLGATWCGPDDAPTAQYEVDPLDGESSILVDRDEIRMVSPTSGYDDFAPLLAAIADVLCNATSMSGSAEPARFRYVIGDHEVLDIEINYESFRCVPTAEAPRTAPPAGQDGTS